MSNGLLLRLTAVAALLLQPLITHADSRQQIESRFQKKLFFIRGFYRDDQLVYDAQGNVQGQPHPGPWSLGLVQVDKVEVRSDEFRLQGHRAAAVYDSKQKKFRNMILSKAGKITITVRTPTDALSDSTLAACSDRMFLERVTAQDVPDPWRNFFLGSVTSVDGMAADQPVPGLESDAQPVFRAGPKAGITPPKMLSHSEPSYTEEARKALVQGTCVLNAIVNRQGVPERIEVSKPLGVGLDDSAIATVNGWRFKPAEKAGQPVAVFISVEVEFRLN